MCIVLFSVLALILVTSIILMLIYHRSRKQAAIKTTSKSFYYIFAFIFFWMVTRTIYYTDAFINYSYTVQGILQTLPNLFTYLCITIAISNVIHLCFLIENQKSS